MQLARADSLCRHIAHRTRQEFDSLPGRRQRRSDRCGSQGPEDGYATGQCDPSGNGRASSFSEPRTTHDASEASRKISRCSGAHAARLEDRDQWTKPQEAINLARYLAGVVGRAHGRQMKASQRRAWRSDLAKNHKASLEAPSWLWASVVELLGLHEAAYLEHCRRFALSEAA